MSQKQLSQILPLLKEGTELEITNTYGMSESVTVDHVFEDGFGGMVLQYVGLTDSMGEGDDFDEFYAEFYVKEMDDQGYLVKIIA